MNDRVWIIAELTVTEPNGRTTHLTQTDVCDREQAQYIRGRLRANMVRELDQRDLLFGCRVGRLTIRTETWTCQMPIMRIEAA